MDQDNNVVVRLSREEAKVTLMALNWYTGKVRDDPHRLKQTEAIALTVARARDLTNPPKGLAAEQEHR